MQIWHFGADFIHLPDYTSPSIGLNEITLNNDALESVVPYLLDLHHTAVLFEGFYLFFFWK